MKTEDGSGANAPAAACWFRKATGEFSAARTFGALFVVGLGSAILAGALIGSVGAGAWLAVLVAGAASAALAFGLVVRPLARSYEANLRARARSAAPSTVDTLTRIPNRRGITASLLDAMAYAGRYGHPLSVALVDVDLLRELNREAGRKAGDKALQAVAAVFADTLRMPDRAGRYGDEEFLVILPNTSLKNAAKIAERIREGVESAEASVGGKKLPVTVSIGASQFRKGEDLERFLSRVDKALDQAKSGGRNRVVTDRPV